MNRRRFCMTIGAFASTALHLDVAFANLNRGQIHERTALALGTNVRIMVRHHSKRSAQQAMSAALAEVEHIESLMSLYRSESQLSQLNRQRALRSAHPYLLKVLRRAKAISLATDGAFDITIQPLWHAYQDAAKRGELPAWSTISQAQKSVGYRNVCLVGCSIRLHNEARITLNGIAQGFATDQVKRVLLANGISDALIDVGELAGLGSKSGNQAWRAGIQHPRQHDAFVATLSLGTRCLATSGDYATTFTDDFRAHHIFDPRSGVSPQDLASVSVLAPTAMEADALSTAMFVMGVNQSSELLKRKAHVDALFVLKDGRAMQTRGFSAG